MKYKVFSIYDVKAKTFSPPFVCPHTGQALRDFSDLVQDPKTRIAAHPEDYNLQCLGEYDDCSGKISGLAQPEFIEPAMSYVKANA